MKVAIYTRVSTTEQNNDLQVASLTEYAHRQDWKVSGIFSDVISGAKRSRPQLDHMMDLVRQGKFDVVLVWKFDRFARSVAHLVLALEEFERHKVAFVSLRDSIDMTSPSGKLMFHIIGAMAEFERSLIQERVRAGMQAAKKRGKRIGRPQVAINVAPVADMRSVGQSWNFISKVLNIPKTTLRRAARKEGIV